MQTPATVYLNHESAGIYIFMHFADDCDTKSVTAKMVWSLVGYGFALEAWVTRELQISVEFKLSQSD